MMKQLKMLNGHLKQNNTKIRNKTMNMMTDKKIRILFKRNFKEQPIDTFRGTAEYADQRGIKIRGRYFQEIKNTDKFLEMPLTQELENHFIPWNSIRSIKYIDTIKLQKLDTEINNRNVLKTRVRNCVNEP